MPQKHVLRHQGGSYCTYLLNRITVVSSIMLKKFIILTYLAVSRGSAEFEQFPGFELTPSSAEQNSLPDSTPTPTADFNDTILLNSFPSSDTASEMFLPSDPTAKSGPPSDTIIENYFPTSDTASEMFPPSDPTVKSAPLSDAIIENSFATSDIASEMFPPSDPTVKNSPPSDTIVDISFPTNYTGVDLFPSSDPTVKNAAPSDTTVDNSFPINDTTVEIFPPSDPTDKRIPSTDTTIEYSFPTRAHTVDNSPPTDLTVKHVPSIDPIIKFSKISPPVNYTPIEDSAFSLDAFVKKTSETPDLIDNFEWGNVAADLEHLVNNYPCSGQDCPKNYKTTHKPFELDFILTRVPRVQTHDVQKDDCPVERTVKIGTFIVPSQLDIIKTMRKLLQNTFANYRTRTISFLEDIDKASKSMREYENSCFNKTEYLECVERVSSGTKMITSSVLNSMDNTMRDVEFLYENLKCNLSDSATIDDPMKLIKFIASEAATIDFAMPGYLRLLCTCFRFCPSHSEDITLLGSYYSFPKKLEKAMQTKPQSHSIRGVNLKDSRLLHFSSRPRYKKLGRMISLKGKPAGGLKYLNSDRISYIKKQ